jgi:site-specific recombinase XerD
VIVMGEANTGLDVASLRVPALGAVVPTGDPWQPFNVVDAAGMSLGAVSAFLRDLQARECSPATQSSYSLVLLRWFRFLWAAGVRWDHATRVEARDFSRWLQLADKQSGAGAGLVEARPPNAVTGKRPPGPKYAPATRGHSESVLRGFYEFHLEAGTGPMVNPFPLERKRRHRGPPPHSNPRDPERYERTGLYRPKVARRAPRRIPDHKFDELFALLPSHRDRALVAFWVSTGARASELLGVTQGDVDAGQQLIGVIRKGSRALQQVPASPDAFVWLRLYQVQMHGLVPAGPDQPLWWTMRQPFRQLTYHAAYRMFTRANAALGSNWSLHDLRHTAAYRMREDPDLALTDVQWILGHARISTTQIYGTKSELEAIASVVAHHARRAASPSAAPEPSGLRYRPESLKILFGEGPE